MGVLSLAVLGLLLPKEVRAQECEDECLGCELELIGGELYHSTSSSSTGDACVQEEQAEAHGTGMGCSNEPHAGDCAGGCFTGHGACVPEEEDLETLVAAASAMDFQEVRRVLDGIENGSVIWNEGRGVFQVLSSCSPEVVFQLPMAGDLGWNSAHRDM